MIDFATLQGLTIPEGVVTQITDASGRVLWQLNAGGPIVLQVEKITSDTYVGSTTYTGEQFILLDIYPKTNGTVNVTYGGLTKTITDTSGAGRPNAQEVYFGTYGGVSDAVETPASGELIIDGDCFAFGASSFSITKTGNRACNAITAVKKFGSVTEILPTTFGSYYSGVVYNGKVKNLKLPKSVIKIWDRAFEGCTELESVNIPPSVEEVGLGLFRFSDTDCVVVADGNNIVKVDGNCLIRTAENEIISGFNDSVIPAYITNIGMYAFQGCTKLKNITIPANVTSIGSYVFDYCTGLESVTFENGSGWWVGESASATEGEAVDVSDPVNNVTLLTSTHMKKHWHRS